MAICAPVKTDPASHISTANSSARFVVIQLKIFFWIFWKIILHWRIANTKLEKLSSNKIISAASFATSVPVFHIATQIWAVFKAGASFTPSPVTATINPSFLQCATILTLSSGETLENIADHSFIKYCDNWTSLISDNSPHVNVWMRASLSPSHTFCAIANAVLA